MSQMKNGMHYLVVRRQVREMYDRSKRAADVGVRSPLTTPLQRPSCAISQLPFTLTLFLSLRGRSHVSFGQKRSNFPLSSCDRWCGIRQLPHHNGMHSYSQRCPRTNILLFWDLWPRVMFQKFRINTHFGALLREMLIYLAGKCTTYSCPSALVHAYLCVWGLGEGGSMCECVRIIPVIKILRMYFNRSNMRIQPSGNLEITPPTGKFYTVNTSMNLKSFGNFRKIKRIPIWLSMYFS